MNTKNNNFSFKPVINNKRKSLKEKNSNSNNINFEYQTTEPSTSNVQDIFQKQKKLNEDLATISTNLNFNNDPNEKTISYTTPYKNNFNQVPQTKQINNVNIVEIDKQKDRLDELINKFNNLYSSENDNKLDNNEYHTIRNIDINKKRNIKNNSINNINTDKINSHHLYENYHNINKSSDDLNYINKKSNQNRPKKILINNIKKNNTDLIPNNPNNYYSYRNKALTRPRNSFQNTSKIKPKSYSSNQISKDFFNPLQEKKLINSHYSNTNLDNENSEISTMSLKANKVINEFKKTLAAAEKIENDLNKSKYSLNTYGAGNNTTNDLFNINNNLTLNQTNTDINNSQNSFFNNNNLNNLNKNTNIINEGDITEEEDEIEKIKIQNEILLKSNSFLKNQNKILTYEINS